MPLTILPGMILAVSGSMCMRTQNGKRRLRMYAMQRAMRRAAPARQASETIAMLISLACKRRSMHDYALWWLALLHMVCILRPLLPATWALALCAVHGQNQAARPAEEQHAPTADGMACPPSACNRKTRRDRPASSPARIVRGIGAQQCRPSQNTMLAGVPIKR